MLKSMEATIIFVERHELIELKVYLKLLLYLVLFNTMFILTTFVLHEAGHYIVGSVFFGCTGSIVLYDAQNQGPYTVLSCDGLGIGKLPLYLSSLTFTVPFALLFLLLRGFEEKHFFLVILGVAIMSTAFDIQEISGAEAGRYATIFVGMMVFIAGEYIVIEDMFERFKDKICLIHSGRMTRYAHYPLHRSGAYTGYNARLARDDTRSDRD